MCQCHAVFYYHGFAEWFKDKCLDTSKIPKLNNENVNKVDRSVTNENKMLIKKTSSQRRAQDQTDSLLKSNRPLKNLKEYLL